MKLVILHDPLIHDTHFDRSNYRAFLTNHDLLVVGSDRFSVAIDFF